MSAINGFSTFLPLNSAAPAESGARVGNKAESLRAAVENTESMFISQLLKEMRQSLDSEGLFAGDSSDVYGGMFDMYLSQHLSHAGGIGLTSGWMKQLQQAYQLERPHDARPGRTIDGHRHDVPRSPAT